MICYSVVGSVVGKPEMDDAKKLVRQERSIAASTRIPSLWAGALSPSSAKWNEVLAVQVQIARHWQAT
jgi:hypothetical protein